MNDHEVPLVTVKLVPQFDKTGGFVSRMRICCVQVAVLLLQISVAVHVRVITNTHGLWVEFICENFKLTAAQSSVAVTEAGGGTGSPQ